MIDKDDNNPVFEEKNMTRGVRVNAPIYTEIGEVRKRYLIYFINLHS